MNIELCILVLGQFAIQKKNKLKKIMLKKIKDNTYENEDNTFSCQFLNSY